MDKLRSRLPKGAAIAALCFGSAWAQQPDVQEIIKRSVAANDANWQAAPNYTYKERNREAQGTKTYQVMMIEGSQYRRLIAVNGKPLSQAESAREQQKLEQVMAKRRSEPVEDRQRRIAKYQRDRKRDHMLIQQLTIAFDFRLLGERTVNSRETYVLRATPRPGYKPPSMETQVLTGMQGQMWIDKATYQWVKVTAQVIYPVSIEGFLAQVEPGTRFEVEYIPVGGGIWQPGHFAMRSHAKVLYMFNHASQDDETYFDYQKNANPYAVLSPHIARIAVQCLADPLGSQSRPPKIRGVAVERDT